ncbi:MAG TPA: hypothetical protein VHB46_08135 [Burkholderiales bacterium]|nr:hypothetical protein [Burkholderiales bacterium]
MQIQEIHRITRLGHALSLAAALLLPAIAHAQLVINGGVEYFRWTEETTPEVRETGEVGFLGLAWTQAKDEGTLFGYRGRIWGGTVDYDGATLFGGMPLQSKTTYEGINNEAQIRYRKSGGASGSLDGLLGIGLDLWRRELSSVQKEDYSIGYVRLGIESNTNYKGQWTAGIGVKYPFWTYENAHFDKIGFDSNPILHPGKEVSPYASLGFRFTPKFQTVAYYEGYRFSRSDPVQTNEVANGLGPTSLVQPASNMSIFGIKLEYMLH